MLTLSIQIKSLLFGAGIFAGTVDAIAGGGGLISLPLLMSIGLPAPMALGTNKLQASIGTSMATYNYFKNKLISFQILAKGLLFGFVGASLGSLTAQWIDSFLLEKILPFLMLLIFFYTLFSEKLGLLDSHPRLPEPIFYMIFGFALGFYDGFLGPGTGSFWVISLVYFLGYNLAKATAYTKVFNLKSNIIATLWFIVGSNIDYRIAFIMACGQLLGGKMGSHLVIHKGAKFVRPIFLIIVFSSIIVMLYKSYFSSPFIQQLSTFSLLLTSCIIAFVSFILFYYKVMSAKRGWIPYKRLRRFTTSVR